MQDGCPETAFDSTIGIPLHLLPRKLAKKYFYVLVKKD
jgi:hypothetical protein